jgi:methylated-DNA-protein-cysteine methyltransferase-like protein
MRKTKPRRTETSVLSENQRAILQTVKSIPRSKVLSYGSVATLSGFPGAARLVAPALKKAPASMKIPWHRVISTQGKISLPKGSKSAKLQAELLRAERIIVKGNKVDMHRFDWMKELNALR